MFDRHLREVKEQALHPLADQIGCHLHPITLTLIGGAVGVGAGLATLAISPAAGLVLWGLNRLLDGLDGVVARRFGNASEFGGYLDIMVDYLIYALLPVALAVATDFNQHAPALVYLLAVYYINGASWMMLASILEKHNRGAKTSGEMTTITMPTGLIEGTETVVFYAIFFLFPHLLSTWFIVYGTLTLITALQRVIWAQRHLNFD